MEAEVLSRGREQYGDFKPLWEEHAAEQFEVG